MKLSGKKFNRKLAVVIAVVMVAILPFTHITQVSASQVAGQKGRITYSRDNGISSQLFSVKADGTDKQQLTNNIDYPLLDKPKYSPDGTKIAYIAITAPTILYIANADGSNEQVMENAGFVTDFDWSPDGTKLVVAEIPGGNNSQRAISIVHVDGSSRTTLFTRSYIMNSPHFSPDGSKIVYYSDNDKDIHVMNADGTGDVNLTNGSADESFLPSWSPDGSKIVYSIQDLSGPDAIVVMNADGSNKSGVADGAQAVFSPDGTKIAYANGAGELHIVDPNGTNDQLLLSDDVATISWQSLNLGPKLTGSLTLTTVNGNATLNVPSMYTDPYGGGINNNSIQIVAAPTKGTTSIDPVSGVITYTAKTVAVTEPSLFRRFTSFFVGTASAATANDQFSFRVCSTTSSALCTTGAVAVYAGAPNTGAGLPSNNMPFLVAASISMLSLGTALLLIRASSHRRHDGA